MTDPKEAAIQRLADEYIRAWDADETLPDWAIERLWLLARIAIEQGVEKVWERVPPTTYAGARGIRSERSPIPWDAVCPEDPREQGTQCQGCGKRYRCDWNVPDPLWAIVSRGCNLLCGPCLARRVESYLEEHDNFAAYEVQEICHRTEHKPVDAEAERGTITIAACGYCGKQVPDQAHLRMCAALHGQDWRQHK